MFVKSAYRGSTDEVAYKLLRILLDWCQQNTVQEIFLGTTPKFLTAHRFYEKNNFIEIQESELPLSFPVMSVDTKFYRYQLDFKKF
jgi:N-acetylglutamate synthase-like GNAT family acetyltransferase